MATVQPREMTDEEIAVEITGDSCDFKRLSPHEIAITTWFGAEYRMRWTKAGIKMIRFKERDV